MTRVSDTAPPRILDVTDVVPLDEGHGVAVIILDTDDGPMQFAVNRGIASLVAQALVEWLGGPYPEDEEAEASSSDG
jgi:hypothetical protein